MAVQEALRGVKLPIFLSRIRLPELFRNPEQEEINRLSSTFTEKMEILDGFNIKSLELNKEQSTAYADIGRGLPVTINPERIKGGWQMGIINSAGCGEVFGLKGNNPFLREVWIERDNQFKIEILSFRSSQEAKIAALKRWVGYAATAESLFKPAA